MVGTRGERPGGQKLPGTSGEHGGEDQHQAGPGEGVRHVPVQQGLGWGWVNQHLGEEGDDHGRAAVHQGHPAGLLHLEGEDVEGGGGEAGGSQAGQLQPVQPWQGGELEAEAQQQEGGQHHIHQLTRY